MKYKIGDKVTLTNGNVMTVDQIDDISKWYRMREDPWNCYTDEMIEGLVEEENKDMDKELRKCKSDFKYWVDNYMILPDGYVFKDENGNLIYANKIILEKKKKEYPKTYAECCEIVGDALKWDNPFRINRDTHPYIKHLDNLIERFCKLLICRDAYWKIAGEEMELGKPWEPDWYNDEKKYTIEYYNGEIIKDVTLLENRILVFPTEEMRDAFYENFKELIEQCKELL